MTGPTPQFDIMMPYYGDVGMMQDAVRSVLALDGDDWRLTVVDDGTEPDVPGWFEQLADPRVRYFRNERNLGVTGNFNRCLELADFDHVVLMGCDDLMHPNYLRVVRGALASTPDAAMVQPGVLVIDGSGKPADSLVDSVKRRIYAPKEQGTEGSAEPGPGELHGEELAVSLLRGNWLYFPAICWRTDAVRERGFREDLKVIQDLALVMELVVAGERLTVAGEVCFSYRRHALSESSAQAFSGDRFAEARRFFLETADLLDRQGWPRAAAVARRHLSTRLHALTLLPGAVRRGNSTGAGTLLRFAALPARRNS
ncbi:MULTISPECIES: glycosyltransferase family 2 protein [Streptacidiphilus]|uniref:Glycosyltransferase family 2 protein n=1 Tax=Streptacidiphilus cavernicola TaxID=3342716 RepID=A0ABV6UGG4_9ACTN|nr:glycosyltransferase family 2 protein [Streptacidiphilus jeojiense]